MKKIVILNGAGKANGYTAALVKAFTEGAQSAGHSVREFQLQRMNIRGCLDCQGCTRKEAGAANPCVQKDDMEEIYPAFQEADIIVFASPSYWGTISGTLKTAVDRMYAVYRPGNANPPRKQSVLLMTAGAPIYKMALDWYGIFEKFLGWENLGTVLGAEKTAEAEQLGAGL